MESWSPPSLLTLTVPTSSPLIVRPVYCTHCIVVMGGTYIRGVQAQIYVRYHKLFVMTRHIGAGGQGCRRVPETYGSKHSLVLICGEISKHYDKYLSADDSAFSSRNKTFASQHRVSARHPSTSGNHESTEMRSQRTGMRVTDQSG